jgi:hypothetical protein
LGSRRGAWGTWGGGLVLAASDFAKFFGVGKDEVHMLQCAKGQWEQSRKEIIERKKREY